MANKHLSTYYNIACIYHWLQVSNYLIVNVAQHKKFTAEDRAWTPFW